jgi:chemosensory pili system protein ChpC
MNKTASYTEEAIQVLIVPLRGQNIVIPQSIVSEVIPVPEVTGGTEENDWLKGVIEWRGKSVPLVSLELLCQSHDTDSFTRTRRVAIVRGINQLEGAEFYAIEVHSIPHPVRLTKLDIQPTDDELQCELYQQSVKASGVFAQIVNFDLLEEKIHVKLQDS